MTKARNFAESRDASASSSTGIETVDAREAFFVELEDVIFADVEEELVELVLERNLEAGSCQILRAGFCRLSTRKIKLLDSLPVNELFGTASCSPSCS